MSTTTTSAPRYLDDRLQEIAKTILDLDTQIALAYRHAHRLDPQDETGTIALLTTLTNRVNKAARAMPDYITSEA